MKGFVLALNRFMSQRGVYKKIYSDSGTNFKGAQHELHDLYDLFKNEHFHTNLQQLFIPFTINAQMATNTTKPARRKYGNRQPR